MAFDPLKLSSGLLDNDDVTFRDAIFRTDPEFRDGQVLFLDATLLTGDGEETNQYFGCGGEGTWETNDDGATAERVDQRDINFNKKAKLGELFNGLVSVMKVDGKADTAIRARIKQYPLGPREAAFWKGLQVHITSQDRKGGGEVDDYSTLVIDGFNGIEGAETGGKAKASTKKASKAAGATKKAAPKSAPEQAQENGKGTDGATLDDLDPAIHARLDTLADDADDHEAFMEAAFTEVPEASSDVLVRTVISDGGEGSLWAEAVARYAANPS